MIASTLWALSDRPLRIVLQDLSNKPIINGPAPEKEDFENKWLKAADLTTIERDIIIDHFTLKNRKIKGLGSIAKLGTEN